MVDNENGIFKDNIAAVKYDSAKLNDVTREMFLNCDSKSADASNISDVRERIREFARKEVANNAYAKRLTLIVSGDTIGRGPRVQITDETKHADRIESLFTDWAEEVNLSEKLRTARVSKMIDGESFFIFYRDKKLRSGSKLNVRLIECDQITTPLKEWDPYQEADGMQIDSNGRPLFYYMLKNHPGSIHPSSYDEYVKIPSDIICHWFRADRPGQHRGVSEFAPSLPLFYMLRRLTLATVEAAEIAANFPLVLYTDSPAIDQIKGNETPFCSFMLQPKKITALPEAWKLGQVHAEQPTTTYADFKRELLAEIAGAFCVPVNIITGDSSRHNYASARVDLQSYRKSIDIERKTLESNVLNKIFERWFEETFLVNVSPKNWFVNSIPKITWFWEGFPHSDPTKDAKAQTERLNNLTSSLSIECARQGIDWQTHLQQIARERAKMRELGIDVKYENLVNQENVDEQDE